MSRDLRTRIDVQVAATGGNSIERLNRAFAQTQSTLNGIAENSRQTQTSLADAGADLAKIAVAASGLSAAVRQAIDFESALAGVKKVVDGTDAEFEQLTKQIQQLGVDLGIGSTAVAQLAAAGGQLGVPIDELTKFSEIAGKMAVAFNMSADEAGNAAAKLANVFGIPILHVEQLGDAINTLGNNTAAKEREIVEALLRIGGSARQFGLVEEQAAALSATMIALGKSPEVAATGINALLSKLMTAQSQGKEFQSALARIGLSAEDLARSIQENPVEALNAFLSKLSDVPKAQQALVNTKLFGTEYADDIAALTQNLHQYQSALGLVADKTQTAGALSAEFSAQSATTAAKLQSAAAALNNLAQTIGKSLLPLTAAGADGVAMLGGALNDLAKVNPHLTQLLTLIAGARGALAALGVVVSGLQTAGLVAMSTQVETLRQRAQDLVGWAQKAAAVFASFEIGHSVGTWLRESSDYARELGDYLGKGVAYLDALLTDRTLEDVATQFETSAQAAARLKEETQLAAQAQAELATQSALAAESQTQSVADVQSALAQARAELARYQQSLETLAQNGLAGSAAFEQTAAKIKELQQAIDSVAIVKGVAELEAFGAALDTLKLSVAEFETGISQSAQNAVSAFQTLAQSTDNVEQLARAYNAARDAIGQSVEGQQMLQSALQDSTAHSAGLAAQVLQTAESFKNFGQNAIDSVQQAQSALQALGISLEDVQRGLSAGVTETVENWRVGFGHLRQTGELTASAVQSAFARATASLHTSADFQALQSALQETGSLALLTGEQMRILQAGAQGGAAAVTQIELAYQRVATQSQQTAQAQITAHQAATQSALQNANAVEKVSEAVGKVNEKARVESWRLYQSQGLLAEQMQQLNGLAKEWESAFMGSFVRGEPAEKANKLAGNIKTLEKGMREANQVMAEFEGKIQNGTLTMEDMDKMSASLYGRFARLDSHTLSRLRGSIDKARQSLSALRDEAKDTADELEAKLASLKGDDSKIRAREQNKEIQALEQKQQSALSRGNRAEAQEYARALQAQRAIHAEQNLQEQTRKQQEVERLAKARQSPHQSPKQNALSAAQVATAWDERIKAAEQRGAQNFAQELYNAAKRQAR